MIALLVALLSSCAWASASHEGKSFDLTASPVGLTVFGDVSISEELAASFHVTDDDLISVRLMNYPDFGSDYSDDIKGLAFGVYYQKYFSDSFNVKLGVSHGSYEYSKPIGSSSSNGRSYYKDTQTVIEVRVGNQWTWSNFTLGCDWIGYGVPLTTSTSRDDGHFSYVPATEMLRLVQFYIGLSY